MNKAISINLAGIFFHIEEDAYDFLEEYLLSIKRYFSQEEAPEILEDIEARVAEMFQESLKKHKRQVVLLGDVQAMISVMGHPEQFDETEDTIEETVNSKTRIPDAKQRLHKSRSNRGKSDKASCKRSKRFYRDDEDKVLGGVCSGIAAYFGVEDPLWIRLAFVIALMMGGFSFWFYVLLWVIVPVAKTSAEKLAMRGEAINVHNIEKEFKDGVDHLTTSFQKFSKSKSGKKTHFFFNNTRNFIRDLVPRLLVFGLKVVRVGVIILAIMLLFALISSLFGLLIGIISSIGFLIKFVFTSVIPLLLSIAFIICLVGVPIFLISYALSKRTLKFKHRSHYWGRTLGLIWIISLIGLGLVAKNTYSNEFASKSVIKETINLQPTTANTLIIDRLDEEKPSTTRVSKSNFLHLGSLDKVSFDNSSSTMFIKNPRLDVVKSETNEFKLVRTASASGKSNQLASALAKEINHTFEQKDSLLKFSPFYSTKSGAKWRNQRMKLTLHVPIGKAIYLTPNADDVIYDIENVTDTYDGDMVGKTWIMREEGLTLLENSTAANQPIKESSTVSIAKVPAGSKKQQFDITDFSKIEISGLVNTFVKRGKTFSVEAVAHEKVLKNLSIDKEGNTLVIDFDKDWKFSDFFGSSKQSEQEPTVYVTMPNLNLLDISGLSKNTVDGFREQEMKIDASGGSKLNLDSEVKELLLDASGASNITLEGGVGDLNMDVSGASTINGMELQVFNAEVELSGAARSSVLVTNALNAEVTGAASLQYKGNPETLNIEKSGVGSVSKLD